MVMEVLCFYWQFGCNVYFVLNVDGMYMVEMFKCVDLECILFIIVFKLFIIQEIMVNVYMVWQWFLDQGVVEIDIFKYFVVVFINVEGVVQFGIDMVNMFEFWDWVGGCYLFILVIGLLIVCIVGYDYFE